MAEEKKKEEPKPKKEKWVCEVCKDPRCGGHLGIDV
jgi:hypothetical protein